MALSQSFKTGSDASQLIQDPKFPRVETAHEYIPPSLLRSQISGMQRLSTFAIRAGVPPHQSRRIKAFHVRAGFYHYLNIKT